MPAAHKVPNPFALMMNPEVILQAMERSDRLGGLQRRVYRPLDKPMIPHTATKADAFDLAVDAEPEASFDNSAD
jgi:hypothetical protein